MARSEASSWKIKPKTPRVVTLFLLVSSLIFQAQSAKAQETPPATAPPVALTPPDGGPPAESPLPPVQGTLTTPPPDNAPPQNPPATPQAAPSTATPATPADPDALPQITAKTYGVKVIRRSNSNRTYLFDDVAEASPKVGRILLLRRENEPVMAFRILKTYPENKQFAGRRIKRYGENRILDDGSAYLAVEKLGDINPPPPTAEDKADLKELESNPTAPANPTTPVAPPAAPKGPVPEVMPYDPELDAGTSPPPSGAVDSDNSKDKPPGKDDDDDEVDSHLGLTVDEVYPLDPNRHWLTAGFGFFLNANQPASDGSVGGASYWKGGGLRYGISLGKMLFLRKAHVQDSLAVEAGAFFYVLQFQDSGSAYDTVAIPGTLRYNIMFGENFGIFFYGGVMENLVISKAVPTGATDYSAAYTNTIPAAGGGLILRIGPSWDARADIGIDMIGIGLMLRF